MVLFYFLKRALPCVKCSPCNLYFYLCFFLFFFYNLSIKFRTLGHLKSYLIFFVFRTQREKPITLFFFLYKERQESKEN